MSVVFYQILFTNVLQISYSSPFHHLKLLNVVEKTISHGLAAHTCLCDIKACASTLASARFSLSCATTPVTSRRLAVPAPNFKQMGFFPAMSCHWTGWPRRGFCLKPCSPQLVLMFLRCSFWSRFISSMQSGSAWIQASSFMIRILSQRWCFLHWQKSPKTSFRCFFIHGPE